MLSLRLSYFCSDLIRSTDRSASHMQLSGPELRIPRIMTFSDQDLLARIATGDGAALGQLYDRHSRLIYGLVLGMLRDTDEAEDLVQEIFVVVWRKASTYKEALGNPKNWLVRIAHNRALNVIRSKRMKESKLGVPIPDEDEPENRSLVAQLSEAHVFEDAVRKEESQLIAAALDLLPTDQRELVDLAFFQGYSHSEIAEITGLPLGTVKTRIRSGITSLRSNLQPLKGESI